ncbi:MAG: hypothetical protein EB084_23865, partial [Proteobacteria bacterium]|nr:hypothetical protein [Pseudomonadota bacterium]
QHGADDARAQAESAARAPATAKGEEEAKASDATAVGRASGDSEGHQAALDRAKTFDLQRGRDAYRTERLNAPPRLRETTSLYERSGGLDGLLAATHLEGLAQAHVSIPSPRRSCARSQAPVAPNEASRYWEGYWRCYDEGYRHAYVEEFRAGYARGCAEGEQRGIARAQRLDYDSEMAAAREHGYREGYAASHDSAYASARAAAYTPAHAGAYTAAHDETYAPAYASAFERIRGEAYSAAYTRLREAARTAARSARYDAEYPTFAVCWYLRGRQLEADDFRQRPVRIMGVDASTLSASGADPAGREVSFRVKLRNFSNASVARERFIYAVDCTPATALVRVDPRPGLTRALHPESEVDVADMVRIRLSDAVRGTVRVTLKVSLGRRGQITDTAVVDVDVPASK